MHIIKWDGHVTALSPTPPDKYSLHMFESIIQEMTHFRYTVQLSDT